MSSNHNKVNSSFKCAGEFWSPESPEQKIFGTITCKKGRAELNASVSCSQPEFGPCAEKIVQSFNNGPNVKKFSVLSGNTTIGKIALLSATDFGGGINFVTSAGISIVANKYRIHACIIGMHIGSLDGDLIEHAEYSFSDCSHLFPTSINFNWVGDKFTISCSKSPERIFRFDCGKLNATVECRLVSSGPVSRKKASIKSRIIFTVSPRTPKPVEWFVDVAFRIENFLTLCNGSSINVRSIKLKAEDEEGDLILQTRPISQNTNFRLQVRLSAENFSTSMNAWLSVEENSRPIEKMLLNVLRRTKMPVETEFLCLAQAIEGFDRITALNFHKKDKIFRERIKDCCSLLDPDYAKDLLGEIDTFVGNIVDTRNYYTHLGDASRVHVIHDSDQLFMLNQKLYSLLRYLMLQQTGVPPDELQQPIRHQATRYKLL